MSLHVEMYGPSGWRRMGVLREGQPPGSMSHNPSEGPREIVMFRCHGDYSTVERSVAGVDAEIGPVRAVLSVAGRETIARLEPGQKIELMVVPDGMQRATRVRFRHE